jgi:hypothetical protein
MKKCNLFCVLLVIVITTHGNYNKRLEIITIYYFIIKLKKKKGMSFVAVI